MQLSTLPPELLQRVLQKVDLPQRLCCGLACKAWHAAAVAATTSIQLVAKHQQSAATLGEWLRRHGSNVVQMSMRGENVYTSCLLPTQQLTQLQQLHCEHACLGMYNGPHGISISNSNGCAPPSASQQASLSHLTRLTSLQMERCTLNLHAGLQALSSLSQLQRLVVGDVEVCDGDEKQHSSLPEHMHSAHVEVQLSRALPHLVQLTHLTFNYIHKFDTAVQQLHGISCLRGLKELTLDCDSSCLTSASFTALPQCLTRLEVKHAMRINFTSSTTPSLAQLTALQHLDLECIAQLEPALLSGFVGLRHLRLSDVGLVPEGGAATAALLAAIGQMTALQHVELYQYFNFSNGNIPAAACAALTASSQLNCLRVYDALEALPAGAGRFMFAKERQLPSLQVLGIGLAGTPPGAAAEAGQGDEQLSEWQYSLNSIASSCPLLRQLNFAYDEWEVPVPLHLDCLQLLQGSLTQLSLANFRLDGARAATTLVALTGLQNLCVKCRQAAVRFTCPDMLQLTRLQRLEAVDVCAVWSVDGETVDSYNIFDNKAGPGDPPDVWVQIHQFCMSESQECVRLFQQGQAELHEQLASSRAKAAALQQQLAAHAAGSGSVGALNAGAAG